MCRESLVEQLSQKSKEIRKGIIRYIEQVGVGHVGGALSMTEIAVALYDHTMRWDPRCAGWPQRDRLVLSKGHCCDALAAVFIDRGIYSLEEVTATHEKGPDTIFSMHPCRKFMPFYEASTGALGHGFSIAQGMALAARQYAKTWRTFCIVGDGELDEGSNWEAIMSAAHYRLGNLICILDRN